jgi:hypothetical protein
MYKCGYVVHKTMPLALARQIDLVQSGRDIIPSKMRSAAFPKISTQYERLINPPSTDFWYIRAWNDLFRRHND